MTALIVTAELGRADFAWLEAERRRHYPAERNQVPAHLTIFRSLPPSAEADARRQLALHAAEPPPRARLAGVINFIGGVAYRVVSEDLDRIRDSLVDHFHGLLSMQDMSGWLPHVTIQNKVERQDANALVRKLEAGFTPRPLAIRGLGLHRYLGGQWEQVAVYPFRGG